MPDSALERVFANLSSNASSWIRTHDRFVVIGFLFSLLPLPPACFVGLVLGLANLFLLQTGALDRKEAGIVKLGCLLALVNSVVVGLLMWWIARHVHGTGSLADLPFVPTFLGNLIEHVLQALQWIFQGPHRGTLV